MSTQGSFEPSGVIANVLRHDRVNSSPSGRGPRFFLGSACSLVSLINHSKTLFRGICLLRTSKDCHSEARLGRRTSRRCLSLPCPILALWPTILHLWRGGHSGDLRTRLVDRIRSRRSGLAKSSVQH